MHTEQRQQSDDINLIVNMVTGGDPGHRTMALATATVFAEENRVPGKFLDAVAAYVSQNNTLRQQTQNNAVVEQVASESPLTAQAQSTDTSLPIRVYIQYSNQDDKYKVEAIRQSLNGLTADGKTIIAPPIEHVLTKITAPTLKCFRPEECKKFGGSLVAALKNSGAPQNLSLVEIHGYETSTAIRPNHFEAWLSPIQQ